MTEDVEEDCDGSVTRGRCRRGVTGGSVGRSCVNWVGNGPSESVSRSADEKV